MTSSHDVRTGVAGKISLEVGVEIVNDILRIGNIHNLLG